MISCLFVFFMALADAPESWRTAIEKKVGPNSRIAYGSAEILDNESAAIESAMQIAKIELAKSFKVKIKSSSTFESTYRTSSAQKDSTTYKLNQNITENVDGIELVGVDVSNYHISEDRRRVEVAAVLDLVGFAQYLAGRVQEKSNLSKNTIVDRNCSKLSHLINHKKKLLYMEEAYLAEMLAKTMNPELTSKTEVEKARLSEALLTCRRKWSIVVTNEQALSADKIRQILSSEGFLLLANTKRNPASASTLRVEIKPEISEAEEIFKKTSISGKVKVLIVQPSGEEFVWVSPTIRTMESSKSSAIEKLKIRLSDQAILGLKEMIESHL